MPLWAVPLAGEPIEVVGPDLAETLRGIFGASVRTRPEIDFGLASRMRAVESDLFEQYRQRTE